MTLYGVSFVEMAAVKSMPNSGNSNRNVLWQHQATIAAVARQDMNTDEM